MFIPDSTIERWIEEDVPGLDLTSHLLEVDQAAARISFAARNQTVLSGVTEAAAVFAKLGAEVKSVASEGTLLQPGDPILLARGSGGMIHSGWRGGPEYS